MILKKLDADETRLNRIEICSGGHTRMHPMSIISESGLYKLINRSDKPQAKPFQDWVNKVVLPAIRKDGGYILGEEKVATGEMDEDELVFRAMEVTKRKLDRLATEKAASIVT